MPFNCIRFAISILLILLSSSPLSAGEIAIAGDSDSKISIGTHCDYLEDREGLFHIEDLLTGAQQWQPLQKENINSGFNYSTFWIRTAIYNSSEKAEDYFLDLGSSLVDYVDVYTVEAGSITKRVISGDRLAFDSRPLATRTIVVPIQIAPRQQSWIYIRYASYDGLNESFTPLLLGPKSFSGRLQFETLALGIYHGVLISILVYNLFLFISTRQQRFLFYVFYLAAFSAWGFVFRGYGFQYLWPAFPNFNNQILPVLVSLSYVTFSLFYIEYLDIKRDAPSWLYRVNLIMIMFNLLTLVPALLGYYLFSFVISVPSGIALLVISVSTGLYLLAKGSRAARYFMLAFALLAIGVLAFYLQLLDLIESNLITEYGIQIGSCLESLLLAFGLADQMNTLKAEKLKAEQAARAAQLELSNQLTLQVQQRTAELESANRKLEQLATTDDLTGACNRRRFNEIFDAELAAHKRLRVPLAFCMMDVDRFKSFNDQYGHQAGDDVLRKMSKLIRDKLRRSNDYFFRLGGEEFAILFSVDFPAGKALPFIDFIRSEIEKLAIPHSKNVHQVVTASFGLIIVNQISAINHADALYAQADALLYQAKASGRNRVLHQII